MTLFKQATKQQVKLRLALMGASGSGKTLSALRIARGLCGKFAKIALIDTENGSASLYAGKELEGAEDYGPISFCTAQMNPPYLVTKYLSAINEAANADFDVVIVDSLTHAWAGQGGILERKGDLDAKGGNSYTHWNRFTPEQNKLVNAVLHSKCHMICTMRSKAAYELQDNDKGKKVPVKIGMAPIQRDDFEYEFDVVLQLDKNHEAQASKDRSGLFDGSTWKITEMMGESLRDWLLDGAKVSPETESKEAEQAERRSGDDVSEIVQILRDVEDVKTLNDTAVVTYHTKILKHFQDAGAPMPSMIKEQFERINGERARRNLN